MNEISYKHSGEFTSLRERDCKRWRDEIYRKCPLLKDLLETNVDYIEQSQGYLVANNWLRRIEARLAIGNTPITIGSTDEEIDDYSEAIARNIKVDVFEWISCGQISLGFERVCARASLVGIENLGSLDLDISKQEGLLKRVCEAHWWSKRIKRLQRRGYEKLVRELGQVSRKRGLYVSEMNFQRRAQQHKKNMAVLESLVAINESGQEYLLSELAKLGVSNPAIRRAELMVRLRGLEELANAEAGMYQGLFITLTCPSKYHAYHENGRRVHTFCGACPAESQQYLQKLWERVRAKWARLGIHPFGLRVAEPHHDGTPHWHLLLFFPIELVSLGVEVFRSYAMQEDGDEPGAERHRFEVVKIDPEKGSATGYVAKYIAKNIDGFGVFEDDNGMAGVESALRVDAWASIWGIRRFQMIGGPSVTVYRELRRLDSQVDEHLEQMRVAADTSDWASFVTLMGGPICARKDRPLKPWMCDSESPNRYGEIVQSLKGVVFKGLPVLSRFHTWVISQVFPYKGFSRNKPLGDSSELDEVSGLVCADKRKFEVGTNSSLGLTTGLSITTLEYCK